MDGNSWEEEEEEVLKPSSGSFVYRLAIYPAGTHLYNTASPLVKDLMSKGQLLDEIKRAPLVNKADTL
ncbi:hypothetical protein Pmani_015781 [Petrolisthes manimaculis]|uniref:Uncharacterized protein n=1 Tax=Petrolisthes manimaculis TaxID=1843537 RepID=A0AAE1PQ91_9EUCA|nr:hypothetical protein Pmani_015781 [Petrolisthes manimaculis]